MRPLILVIIFGMSSYCIAIDLYSPSMPTMAKALGLSADTIQRTMTLYLLGGVFCAVCGGPLADRYGKRHVYIGGFIVAFFASLLCYFTQNFDLLLLGRFFQGLGAAVSGVVGYALIQDNTPKANLAKAYSLMGVMTAITPALAPILGGYINDYLNWHFNFAVMIIVMALTVIMAYVFVPKDIPRPVARSNTVFQTYRTIFSHKTFLMVALLMPLFMSCKWFYISTFPFYLQQEIGISAFLSGFFFAVIVIGYMVGSRLAGMIVDRFGNYTTLQCALALSYSAIAFFTGIIFIWPHSLELIFLASFLHMVGYGMIFVASVPVAMGMFTELRTTASSARSILMMTFAALGGFAAEKLPDNTLGPMTIYIFICLIIAQTCIYVARDHLRTNPTSQ